MQRLYYNLTEFTEEHSHTTDPHKTNIDWLTYLTQRIQEIDNSPSKDFLKIAVKKMVNGDVRLNICFNKYPIP